MSAFKDRTGEQFKTKEGYDIIIIEYNNANDLLVQFQDEYKTIVHSTYQHCKNKAVKNPYHPNRYGGYIGVGKYKIKENDKITKCFQTWINILERLHESNRTNRNLSYDKVIIFKDWYNFQNFAEWYYNNYYEVDGEQMCIDKDILYKGNKEYAPDKCIFVPERINLLFINSYNNKNRELPIGVSYHKTTGKYQANCNTLDGQRYLGLYSTQEGAFKAYKQFKEQYIKEIADKYKDKIPQELYDAMYRWEVKITD